MDSGEVHNTGMVSCLTSDEAEMSDEDESVVIILGTPSVSLGQY